MEFTVPVILLQDDMDLSLKVFSLSTGLGVPVDNILTGLPFSGDLKDRYNWIFSQMIENILAGLPFISDERASALRKK